jgi:hypothetical protein
LTVRICGEAADLTSAIAKSRVLMTARIQTYLEFIGFPQSHADKRKLSLIPLLFQEANYDNIDWTNRVAYLEHLNDFFELDCMFQNEGKNRADLGEEEFKAYIDRSLLFCRP